MINKERKDVLLMEAIAEALVRQKRSSRVLVKVDAEGTSLTLGEGEHLAYRLPFVGLWVGKEPGSPIRFSKSRGFADTSTDLFYDLQHVPFLDEWNGEQLASGQTLPAKEAFYTDYFDNGLAYRAFVFTPEGKEEIKGREEDIKSEMGREGANTRKDVYGQETIFDLFEEAEYELGL